MSSPSLNPIISALVLGFDFTRGLISGFSWNTAAMTSVGGSGGGCDKGSVFAAIKAGFDRGVFCVPVFFEIACGTVDSDLSAELSLIISSSRSFIFGFVDVVFFSTLVSKVELSRDRDSSGDLSLSIELVCTLLET